MSHHYDTVHSQVPLGKLNHMEQTTTIVHVHHMPIQIPTTYHTTQRQHQQHTIIIQHISTTIPCTQPHQTSDSN